MFSVSSYMLVFSTHTIYIYTLYFFHNCAWVVKSSLFISFIRAHINGVITSFLHKSMCLPPNVYNIRSTCVDDVVCSSTYTESHCQVWWEHWTFFTSHCMTPTSWALCHCSVCIYLHVQVIRRPLEWPGIHLLDQPPDRPLEYI